GILKGKFSYMSPEQVRGLHVDHRSDIFSLGIVLYELLTLERLFLGDSDFDTLEKIRKVEMSPPSLYNPHIPKELEDIVLKALARSPEERFQSAHDLAEALERFMRNQGYYFTNKDLATWLKESFKADIEFENKKLEYYRGLNLKAPNEEGEAMLEKPGAEGDEGLEWGEEEMETQIFDRSSAEVEAVTESQIVYAEEPGYEDETQLIEDGGHPFEESTGQTSQEDETLEYNRVEVPVEPLDQQAVEPLERADQRQQRRSSGRGDQVQTPRRQPQVTVQSQSPGDGRHPAVVIGGVAAAVVVLGLGAYFAFGVFTGDSPASITFKTDPEVVDIYINGERVHSGETPLEQQVEEGSTEIRIESDGYEPYEKNLELEAGQTYSLNQGLRSADDEGGTLRVATRPEGASVEIDGDEHDETTPLTVDELEEGEHKLVISADDYISHEETIEVEAGQNDDLDVELRPKEVALEIDSDPSGARFSIHDKEEDDERVARGRTPETVEELDGEKRFIITVDKSGYREWEEEFEPGHDAEESLTAELERAPRADSSDDSSDKDRVASHDDSSNQDSGSSSGSESESSDSEAGSGGGDGDEAEAGSASSGQGGGKKDEAASKDEPSGTGTVSIASKPTARIHIDGQDTGEYTPLVNHELEAGKYKITLINEDFDLEKTYYVEIKPGENEKVINR
ncbi:MAG: PEGA domain-containing protein, partial [Persicimonas sp.]